MSNERGNSTIRLDRRRFLQVLAGTAGAYATVRVLESQLFGVEHHDPAVFAAAIVLVLIMAIAAAFFPARQAARIDPLVALRHE